MLEAKLKETPEYSDYRIAQTLGLSRVTMSLARFDLESTCQIEKFETLLGADGKWRARIYGTPEEKERLRESNRKRREFEARARLRATII